MARYSGTREYRFEAGHIEYSPQLDEKKNFKLYGKATQPHGHNFVLRAEITGTKNPESEMILDLGKLDWIVENKVLKKWDHFYFEPSDKKIFTLEQILIDIWNDLRPEVDLLSHLTLFESDEVWADYEGDDYIMDITRSYTFNAAHRTENPRLDKEQNQKIYGKCFNLHGHTYTLEVTVRGKFDKHTSLVVNQNNMDRSVQKILDHFDYTILNDIPCFLTTNATTENLVAGLWGCLNHQLVHDLVIDKNLTDLYKIRLRETGRNYFDYYGSDSDFEDYLQKEFVKNLEKD